MSKMFCARVRRASTAIPAALSVARHAVALLGISFGFVLTLACPVLAQTSVGPSPPLITRPLDEANLFSLAGNTRPEAKIPDNDRGIVPDDFPLPHMLLQLRRSAAQEQAVNTLIDQLHDPKSPNFHKWLHADQVGAQFGPAASDIQAVVTWLQQRGFTVNTVYPNGLVIDYSGTAGQVRDSFHTEIHKLSVNGITHFANVTDPRIPAALAPFVVGPVSLHDFKPKPAFSKGVCGSPYEVTGNCYQVTPADLATIYNFNPVFNLGFTGQGQSIYLIEDSNIYHVSDWTTFRSLYGLSGYTEGSLHTMHPQPPNSSLSNCENPLVTSDDSEATLDAEYASAAAPSAAIYLATCASNGPTWGVLVALENLLSSADPPAIVSISYESCEALNGSNNNSAIASIYQTAVMAGTSIFVSAGDGGAADCDQGNLFATQGIAVNALASTAYNVAVGGTDFADTYRGTNSTYWNAQNSAYFGSAKSYIPEIPWNGSCAGQLITSYEGYPTAYGPTGFCNANTNGGKLLSVWAGGGGPSSCAQLFSPPGFDICLPWPKPSWQTGVVGLPNDQVRDLPDIALFASGGPWGHSYAWCFTDPNNGGGPCTANGAPAEWGFGTSFASPIMAGVQALINQWFEIPAEGNPNYRLYQLAGLEYGANGSTICNSAQSVAEKCIFYDITIGDNVVPCQSIQGTFFGSTFLDCYVPKTIPVGPNGSLSRSNSSYEAAYAATTGWDFATGIGSINVTNLISNWEDYCNCFEGARRPPRHRRPGSL
jgi:subtilase family serine protease